MRDNTEQILILGAGLAGSLLAIYLARRGYRVAVYEKRPDIRHHDAETGRSINLALSHRGIRALEEVGIAEQVLKQAIPMRGRMLHSLKGEQTFIPYGKDNSEYINSISRSELNRILIQVADAYEQVTFHFQMVCEEVCLETRQLRFKSLANHELVEAKGATILATDGAGSVVRQTLERLPGYESRSEFLEHGYKELTIPAHARGGFQLEKEALHIWPRGSHMLIALPNLDGSFTCTLFFPNQGQESFESLQTSEAVTRFFKKNFANARALMPHLLEEFQENPVGILGTVKCFPWYVGGRALLVGDAAHAIVPFYGQGMNASFEDCRVFDQCLAAHGSSWEKVFASYQKQRKENTDAIAQLAIENFYEMRDGVTDPAFLRKKALEQLLEDRYRDYHSKYSLVTFHPDISYAEAHRRGNLQNQILLEICRSIRSVEELDLETVYKKLKEEVHF